MALRYKKQSRKEKLVIMACILGVTLMVIVGALALAAFLGTGYIVDKSLEDPDVVLHVFVIGNDVAVTVYEGRRVDELTMLSLEIEGVDLPASVSCVQVPSAGIGEVSFRNACSGVTGTRNVAIRGIFADGGTRLLKMNKIKFT